MVLLPQICAQISLKGPVAELGGERGKAASYFINTLYALCCTQWEGLGGLIILPYYSTYDFSALAVTECE